MAIGVVARGVSADTGGDTTAVVTPASNFAAGSLAVLCCNYDNSGTTPSNGADPFSTIVDSAGNTWTSQVNSLNDPGNVNAGVAARIFTSDMSVATLTTSHTISISFNQNVPVFVWTLWQVTPDAGFRAVFVAGNEETATTATPSIATTALPGGCAVFGFVGREGNGTRTDDTDTDGGVQWAAAQKTGSGSTTSGQEIIVQYKLPTAAATHTYNPTFGGTSRDGCELWAWFSQESLRTPAQASITSDGLAPIALASENNQADPAQADLMFAGLVPELQVSPEGGFFSFALIEAGGAGKIDGQVATPDVATVVLAGREPVPFRQDRVDPGLGAAAFAGYAPTAFRQDRVAPDAGLLSIAGLQPTVQQTLHHVAVPAQAQVLAAGQDPVALRSGNFVAVPGVGSIGAAGLAPTAEFSAHVTFSPGVATAAVAGLQPSGAVSELHTVFPGVGTAAWEGYTPFLESPPSGGFVSFVALELGGAAAPPDIKVIETGVAALSITGQEPKALTPVISFPGVGTVGFTGRQPTLTTYTQGGFFSLVVLEVGGVGASPSNINVSPGVGSIALQGRAPASLLSTTAYPPAGTLAVQGLEPASGISYKVEPGVAALGLTGAAPDFNLTSVYFEPARAIAVLQGRAPTVDHTHVRSIPAGSGTAITGLVPTVLSNQQPAVAPHTDHEIPRAWYVDPGYIAVWWTFPARPIDKDLGVSPVRATLAFAGSAPSLFRQDTIAIGRADLSLAGQTPTANVQHTREPAPAELTIAGRVPVAAPTYRLYPDPAALSFTGLAPNAASGWVSYPGVATISVVGRLPSLVGTGLVTVEPAQASIAIEGQAPNAVIGIVREIAVDNATVAFEGLAPQALVSELSVTEPAQAQASFSGAAPSVVRSLVTAPGHVDLTFVGTGPQIELTGFVERTPDPAALALEGHVPGALLNQLYVYPGQGTAALDGKAPNVLVRGRPVADIPASRQTATRDQRSRRSVGDAPRRHRS